MCGICGEFLFDTASGPSNADFDKLVAMMARRGPDDVGTWSDGPHCTLGFRRLAILDLSAAAAQPMVSPDGRFALVYNGELYNYREIQAQLEQLGVRFHTSGDTEVVLQALMQWGSGALERFNGMFALGFYDGGRRTLLLARDHAGIKPLYYLRSRNGIFFASQYDQIMAHPWRSGLPVSDDALSLYLRLSYIPAPWAILEQTFMLEAGKWLEVSADGRMTQGTFFQFPVNPRTDLSGQEAYEAVDAAVASAVQRQMISDVPLGAFLSGGIDSPLVSAKAQAAHQSKLQAFTIGVAGSELDESAAAVAYARELGVDHHVEQFTADRVLSYLDDVIAAAGEPLADYSLFPTLMVSELARRDVTVMLSGDGGDELFWGYAKRFGYIMAGTSDYRDPYWRRRARWGARRFLGLGNGHRNLSFDDIGHWFSGYHSRLQTPRLQSLFGDAPAWPADFDLFQYSGWQADQTANWLRWNEFVGHLTMVLLKVDRASMYNSLEVRVPLLDREVIDTALRVDWRTCMDLELGQGKRPLRQSLAGHVSHQTHEKRGFTVPMDEWLRGPLRGVVEEKLLSRRDLLGRPLQQDPLHQMIAQHDSAEADLGPGIWTLLNLVLWSERHFQVQPAVLPPVVVAHKISQPVT